MPEVEVVLVPRELYYHETAYVRGLEQRVEEMATACEKTADYIERLETALRRIRSLDPKNVPKYAQQIAAEALAPEESEK